MRSLILTNRVERRETQLTFSDECDRAFGAESTTIPPLLDRRTSKPIYPAGLRADLSSTLSISNWSHSRQCLDCRQALKLFQIYSA
ncbi:hypothetical protein [Phormidesmis priestleyi]